MLDSSNVYTKMQKSSYEGGADEMNLTNHMRHNGDQDYWDILVKDTENTFRDKIGLDFGCGCGRNVQNLWMRFKRMDGVDISVNNIEHCKTNLSKVGAPGDRFRFHVCNGVDLRDIESRQYDFIMSTIVLQHIPVYDIRLSYLKDFFRISRSGALLSFQMGFGSGPGGRTTYYENAWNVEGTNGANDVYVTDPEQIRSDLEKIGFVGVNFQVRKSTWCHHPFWIYTKAFKP